MKIKFRIFLAILVTVGLGFLLLVNWITSDLKPQFRVSTEDPLVDTAWVLAALASSQVRTGAVDVSLFRRAFDEMPQEIVPAPIYDFVKTTVDLRVYITDASGRVIFDSTGSDLGADFSRWNDVLLTLQGRYGTRTSNDLPSDYSQSVMYVAAPIIFKGDTVGVVSVGKPTGNVNLFVEQSKRKVKIGGFVIFSVVVLATLLVSALVTRPIERLMTYVQTVGSGRRTSLPQLADDEIGELGQAFEEMRVALEGKQYVENYVQTLTHEMKSPLAAIQGATELLGEEMPAERRSRFLANIESETGRLQQLIEKLLLLTSIENRRELQKVEEISLPTLVRQSAASFVLLCQARDVTLEIEGEPETPIRCEICLIEHAVANLLQNAIEFSPRGGVVKVAVMREGNAVLLTVTDQGPGIPEYGLPRVFERFYSLKRPDTGKKSTGLGLSLVRETMLLHGGNATLENLAGGGAKATLIFPG
jgi:two-component system sensor histidine kinase CreC